MERIDKILSSQNIATRSEVKNMIKKRLIVVNGKTVLKPDEKFEPETAEICVDGKAITFKKYAQRAGDSVRAFKAEMKMLTAIVTPNSR